MEIDLPFTAGVVLAVPFLLGVVVVSTSEVGKKWTFIENTLVIYPRFFFACSKHNHTYRKMFLIFTFRKFVFCLVGDGHYTMTSLLTSAILCQVVEYEDR